MEKDTSGTHILGIYTFKDFVEYSKQNSKDPHWSFEFYGYQVTHENDECYLINNVNEMLRFTPDYTLKIDNEKNICLQKL